MKSKLTATVFAAAFLLCSFPLQQAQLRARGPPGRPPPRPPGTPPPRTPPPRPPGTPPPRPPGTPPPRPPGTPPPRPPGTPPPRTPPPRPPGTPPPRPPGTPPPSSYRSTSPCESKQICSYKYLVTQTNWDGEQRQVTTVKADVEIWCSSVGTYGSQGATRFCMRVENVTVSGDLLKDNSDDEVLEDTEEEIPELDPQDTVLHDPPISPQNKLLSQWFCFIQADDGKVVAVQHPRGESAEVVNIKKGIASAFQTNFKGTTEEEEEDTLSQHTSSYRYRGTNEVYRTVNTSNVKAYAGGIPRDDIQLSKTEYIRYSDNTLSYSSGSTQVVFAAGGATLSAKQPSSSSHSLLASGLQYRVGTNPGAIGPRKKRQTLLPASVPGIRGPAPSQSQTYDAAADINEMKAQGQYRLYRVGCRSPVPSRGSAGYARKKREADGNEGVTDSLRAKIDYKLIDRHQMQLLREKMPSVAQALNIVHQDTENLKITDLLLRLLLLEAEHKPLPGYDPALKEVLAYLSKLKGSESEADVEMRKVIYSLLSPEGSMSAQKALANALMTTTNKEEKTTLISHIAFTKNPHLKFVKVVERLLDPASNSTDPLLLAYGSLASSSSAATEHHIVSFLLQRLDSVRRLTNNTWPLIHLIHALGNSGSKHSIGPLSPYLHYQELDVQLAAIGAMSRHTTESIVQEAFTDILRLATMEEQVETVTQTLIEGLEHIRMNGKRGSEKEPNGELLLFLISGAMQSNNTKLHELVFHYLHQLDTQAARDFIDTLSDYVAKNPGFEGNTYYVHEENSTDKSRVRRGSDWDASSSIYNLVASYAQRKSDVQTYPLHKAYIWGKKFGLSKVYMQVAAGGFAGIKLGGTGYKLFAKAVAQGHAFGKTATALRAEFLRRRSGSSIYQKIYAKVVGKTLINEAGYLPSGCNSLTKTLYQTSIKLFYLKFSVFIYVGTLDFYVGLYAKLSLHLKLTFCETSVKACATLIPRARLRAEGGASATIVWLVRGGIEVAAEFTYQLEPEVCVQFCKVFPGPTLKTKKCINVYHSWPNNFVEIYAYWQRRKFKLWPPKFYWGSKHKWGALSKKWNLGSIGRKKIWGSCDPNINCFNILTGVALTPKQLPMTGSLING